MQKKKIFIEIAVPQQIKRKIMRKIEGWTDLPIRWVKEESLHITIAFVGFVDESVIPDICEKVTIACESLESFDFDLNEIILTPDAKNPKMAVLMGESSEQLRMLNEVIERELGIQKHSHKEFRPHITLGRVRKLKWDQLSIKPNLAEKFHAVIPVDSVSVMESKGGGAEYVLLEECALA